MKAKKWVMNNIGLKVLSLILAITTWFYIVLELKRVKGEEERAIFSMLRYEVISKKLPVHLALVGEVREGYEVISADITVEPEVCVVIGPKSVLEDVTTARTVPLDISEYTKDIDKQLPLAPIARGIALNDDFVKVHIPIVKKETEGITGKDGR